MINTLSNTQITKKSQNAGRQKKVSDDFIVSSPKRVKTLIIIIISSSYPLTVRVVGAPQMILQPVSSVLHCPLGLGTLQASPFPDVVFRTHHRMKTNSQTLN